MKKYRTCTEHGLLFLISIAVGILLITILSRGKFPENTMMQQIMVSNIMTEGIDRRELLIICCLKRVLFFGTLYLFSFTDFRKLCFRITTVGIGFSLGMLMKLFYLWYAFGGFVIFLAAVLPHYLFYWMAYGMIYSGADNFTRNRGRKLKNFLSIFLVVITGCFLESYVNPFLVLNFIKIFIE